MADTDYITIAEAAIRIKVHPRTILRWINQGKVPAYGVDNTARVRIVDIMRPRTSSHVWPQKRTPRKMCADHKEVAPRPTAPNSPEPATAAPEQG
jgi:excisionase family DNA binding protein